MMATQSRTGLPRLSMTRREALRTSGGAIALGAFGILGSRTAHASATSIVSYSSAGQRWELPQKAVYPLYRAANPDAQVQIVADPISDLLTKAALAISSHSSSYDSIYDDYNYLTQFIAQKGIEPIEPFLDADPQYKADLLADVPENVLDLYRDKPAAEGGKLYGLPPDSNTQLQYWRADAFADIGLDSPAKDWNQAIDIAAKLAAKAGKPVTGTSLRRGNYSAEVFIALLRSHGGDWFDRMGPGGWHLTLDTEAGALAFDVLLRFMPHVDPLSLNASDDESNTAMLNGTWVFAPLQWGGSTMNDPKFTAFADRWKAAAVPKGANPQGRVAPHMGGHGFMIPSASKNKEAAWEWIKFCCSGMTLAPKVAAAWVDGTGQPARLSMLKAFSNKQPYFEALLDSLPHAVRYPPIPESTTLYDLVGTEVSEVVTGGKKPKEALADMQSATTRVMERGGYYRG